MFEINLICVGKLKEKFYQAAVDEYVKRLRGYCKINVYELPEHRLSDSPAESEIETALEKEAISIQEKIPKGAWFCIFTPEGKLLSSEALAEKLSTIKVAGKSSACYLIGSSFGIAKSLKAKADFALSMSPMTFPHHLARIMALEQLYRAESIQAGSKYHK
ncbi:MAG: 23S rRNA (pseudouridine(1915)-N(3))-methyltransferase RlmH [Oscillospiraceae bacterium]|nr:23S rRNA (pseudouridine(1915)-N(3))-methyltransferase RlmH [Oscillospiraceae bacterium]